MFADSDDDSGLTVKRAQALVSIAIEYITRGAPPAAKDTVHRLAKVDTTHGLTSVQNAATLHVPYAVLLYERYLGRPFASHRDSVSELVGDVMESAIEEQLARRNVTFRKTRRASASKTLRKRPISSYPPNCAAGGHRAKITGDDGTARDKVARILRLSAMRDEREREAVLPLSSSPAWMPRFRRPQAGHARYASGDTR